MYNISARHIPGLKPKIQIFHAHTFYNTTETAKLPCATTLPCAQNRAHGEEPLCHVLPEKYTAQKSHTANTYFFVRIIAIHTANTRHTINIVFADRCMPLMVCRVLHTIKMAFAEQMSGIPSCKLSHKIAIHIHSMSTCFTT